MNLLDVQVQPNLLAGFSEEAINELSALNMPSGIVNDVHVVRGNDDGPYINITFSTSNLRLLWPRVREKLVQLGLQGAAIATCTGSRGWDNYLLLHHFNHEVPTDRLSAP